LLLTSCLASRPCASPVAAFCGTAPPGSSRHCYRGLCCTCHHAVTPHYSPHLPHALPIPRCALRRLRATAAHFPLSCLLPHRWHTAGLRHLRTRHFRACCLYLRYRLAPLTTAFQKHISFVLAPVRNTYASRAPPFSPHCPALLPPLSASANALRCAHKTTLRACAPRAAPCARAPRTAAARCTALRCAPRALAKTAAPRRLRFTAAHAAMARACSTVTLTTAPLPHYYLTLPAVDPHLHTTTPPAHTTHTHHHTTPAPHLHHLFFLLSHGTLPPTYLCSPRLGSYHYPPQFWT